MSAPEKSTPKAAPEPSSLPILCPVLGCLIVEGNVAFDPQQRVNVSDITRSARTKARMSCPLAFALTSVGPIANRLRDFFGNFLRWNFRPYELRGGMLKHPGDTKILLGDHFDEERFDAFASHSSDGRSFTRRDMAEVVAANAQRDDTWMGAFSATAEMAAILYVFGYVDSEGEPRIDIKTTRDLFQRTRFPEGQEKHATSGLWAFSWLFFRMFLMLPAANRRLRAAKPAR